MGLGPLAPTSMGPCNEGLHPHQGRAWLGEGLQLHRCYPLQGLPANLGIASLATVQLGTSRSHGLVFPGGARNLLPWLCDQQHRQLGACMSRVWAETPQTRSLPIAQGCPMGALPGDSPCIQGKPGAWPGECGRGA